LHIDTFDGHSHIFEIGFTCPLPLVLALVSYTAYCTAAYMCDKKKPAGHRMTMSDDSNEK